MARFEPDRAGLRQLRRTREMSKAMQEIARDVGVPAFRAAAPVGPTGEYRDLVGVEPHVFDSGLAGAALVLVPDYDDDPNAPVSITFGTADTPEHSALQLAREAMARG